MKPLTLFGSSLALLLLMLLLMTPQVAEADCHAGFHHVHYGHGYGYNYHAYQEAVVVTPIATLLVPSFSFQYVPAVQAPAARAPQAAPHPAAPTPQAAPADDWPSAPVASAAGNLASQAHGIFAASCVKCHAPGGKNTQFLDDRGQLLAEAKPAAILEQIEDDLMPPKARRDKSQALPDAQKAILRSYLASLR